MKPVQHELKKETNLEKVQRRQVVQITRTAVKQAVEMAEVRKKQKQAVKRAAKLVMKGKLLQQVKDKEQAKDLRNLKVKVLNLVHLPAKALAQETGRATGQDQAPAPARAAAICSAFHPESEETGRRL